MTVTVLTPRPVLWYLLDRLRANYVDAALYTDTDVLALLNDAYLDACEESECLQALATIAVVSGTVEYPLPARLHGINLVASGGRILEPVALGAALAGRTINGLTDSYYTFGTTIGVLPTPDEDSASTIYLHYSERPVPFASLDDALDPRFPVEYADLLVHYVRWRVQLTSGGAERIQQAAFDKGVYRKRVQELRVATSAIQHVHPRAVSIVQPNRGIRTLIPGRAG